MFVFYLVVGGGVWGEGEDRVERRWNLEYLKVMVFFSGCVFGYLFF